MLERLRARDEAAFRQLVRHHHVGMVGFARTMIKTRASAEEVVQDTWMAVISGLSGFEGRSSLKSWIFGILVNKARTRAAREGRTITFSDIGDPDGPAVDPDRFNGRGRWSDPPEGWSDITPERILAGKQLWRYVEAIIETLPAGQRSVVTLRDIQQMSPEETSTVLGITDVNQRVLLHRARSKIRRELEKRLSRPNDGVAGDGLVRKDMT